MFRGSTYCIKRFKQAMMLVAGGIGRVHSLALPLTAKVDSGNNTPQTIP